MDREEINSNGNNSFQYCELIDNPWVGSSSASCGAYQQIASYTTEFGQVCSTYNDAGVSRTIPAVGAQRTVEIANCPPTLTVSGTTANRPNTNFQFIASVSDDYKASISKYISMTLTGNCTTTSTTGATYNTTSKTYYFRTNGAAGSCSIVFKANDGYTNSNAITKNISYGCADGYEWDSDSNQCELILEDYTCNTGDIVNENGNCPPLLTVSGTVADRPNTNFQLAATVSDTYKVSSSAYINMSLSGNCTTSSGTGASYNTTSKTYYFRTNGAAGSCSITLQANDGYVFSNKVVKTVNYGCADNYEWDSGKNACVGIRLIDPCPYGGDEVTNATDFIGNVYTLDNPYCSYCPNSADSTYRSGFIGVSSVTWEGVSIPILITESETNFFGIYSPAPDGIFTYHAGSFMAREGGGSGSGSGAGNPGGVSFGGFSSPVHYTCRRYPFQE